jgi:hypothetical protein
MPRPQPLWKGIAARRPTDLTGGPLTAIGLHAAISAHFLRKKLPEAGT